MSNLVGSIGDKQCLRDTGCGMRKQMITGANGAGAKMVLRRGTVGD